MNESCLPIALETLVEYRLLKDWYCLGMPLVVSKRMERILEDGHLDCGHSTNLMGFAFVEREFARILVAVRTLVALRILVFVRILAVVASRRVDWNVDCLICLQLCEIHVDCYQPPLRSRAAPLVNLF